MINKEKNSYNISISNNLNFLKSHELLNDNHSYSNFNNDYLSVDQKYIPNNYGFEKENKFGDSIDFSISSSINDINRRKGSSISRLNNSELQKKSTVKRSSSHFQHELFNNIFSTSPVKYHSSLDIDNISNKDNAIDTSSSTVVLSNRSAKQKELSDLLETSKNTLKTPENDDLDLLELMDG